MVLYAGKRRQGKLYFPTENEENAYVCSAVHENEGNGIRTNPENKIWRNKYGKEIRLTPDGIGALIWIAIGAFK